MAPRHASPWRGPTRQVSTVTAGISKAVDLNERGRIELSPQVMFRVNFKQLDGRSFQPNDQPYFRGLALSDLIIRSDGTDFRAPYDRIDDEHYQSLTSSDGRGKQIHQHFFVEESADPLLYDVYPVFKAHSTSMNRVTKLLFCHEISGLTRKRLKQSIEVLPFEYQTTTYADKASRFYRSWPYISNQTRRIAQPMSADQPQHDWLTKIDAGRYRNLTAMSDQIAEAVKKSGGGRLEFLKAIEDFFLSTGGFKYTLDYTNVRRNEKLDPVEDFVRNHRSGHCEQFAAATTLMLRQQNIPARLVVGYHGGDFNTLTKDYLVRASHAHAWVEAYLRPEDCTEEMINTGAAGVGGAWMIVEATPAVSASELDSTDEAIGLARSVWQDYVLGRDGDDSQASSESPMHSLVLSMDLELWDRRLKSVRSLSRQPWIKYALQGLVAFVVLAILLRQILKHNTSQTQSRKTGLVRRMVAGAVSLFSPQFAQWVMGDDNSNTIKFYQSLEKILATHQLQRRPTQSHLEFAGEVVSSFSQHPESEFIHSTIYEITNRFNAIRFGDKTLAPSVVQNVDSSLAKLRELLATK